MAENHHMKDDNKTPLLLKHYKNQTSIRSARVFLSEDKKPLTSFFITTITIPVEPQRKTDESHSSGWLLG